MESNKAGVPITDISSGIFSALSIITALYNVPIPVRVMREFP